MLGRALSALERAVFEPTLLPSGVVTAVALTPPVIAGLAFFKGDALTALGIAVFVGALLHLVALRLKVTITTTPIVASVVAVALAGPAAPVTWLAALALLAAGLDVARQRFVPEARVQAGLVAYSAIFLSGREFVAAYLNPGSLRPLTEPIQLWSAFGGGAAAPIDPVRLYVGNVPGPMLATSLLAVVIAAAWLWYARRLSLAVVVAFALGTAVPAAVLGWNVAYHLEVGPAWFVVALFLADREMLPASRAARPLLGLAAGVVSVALRTRGAGVEAVFLVVAALQLGVAVLEGIDWLRHNRAVVGHGLHVAQGRVMTRRRAA